MGYQPQTQFAEDSTHTTGDKGLELLAVRNDTRGVLSDTSGDYTPLQTNASGDLRVDNSANTQPVSASALPLPTGASTSAKQPALGTAGTPSADVLTVQGVTSMTALKVDGSATTQPISGTVTASNTAGDIASAATDSGNPVKVGGKYNLTLPTFTDGQRGDIQIDARGSVRAGLVAGGTTNTILGLGDSADATASNATGNKLAVVNRNTVYNGTTWDRQYGNTNGIYSQGNVADAVVDSGNPMKIGGKYNLTQPTYTDGNRADLQLDARGNLRVALQTSGTAIGSVVDNADAVAVNATARNITVVNRATLFNGTSWDRHYANWNVNTGDTGAKTATFNGATQTNYGARGATILFNIGTVSGTTPTLVAKIQGSADGGTTFYDIPGASTASITATGTPVLTVYPGTTVAANAAVSYPLPRTWRVVYTIGGTTPSFTLTNTQVAYVL